MKIAILVYTHRHGTDVHPFILKGNLPKLTNKSMTALGFSDPELDREDEYAEWTEIFDTDKLEVIE